MPENRFNTSSERARRYRERAAEMRRQAVGVLNRELRYILLENAQFYEKLAERMEHQSRDEPAQK